MSETVVTTWIPDNDLERDFMEDGRIVYNVFPPGTIAGLQSRIAELEAQVAYLQAALEDFDEELG